MKLIIEANNIDIFKCSDTVNAVGNNLVTSTIFKKEGLSSISTTANDTIPYIGYNDSVIKDLSNKVIRIWYNSTIPNTLATKDNLGIALYLKDTTGNIASWAVSGSDEYYGGWINVIVDTALPPNLGTVDLLNIVEIGMTHYKDGVNQGFNYATIDTKNTYIDYIRTADTLVCYGDSWTLDDLVHLNNNNYIGIGMVTNDYEAYVVTCILEFGNANTITSYKDSSKVVVFRGDMLTDGRLGINFKGDASIASLYDISNMVYYSDTKKFFLNFNYNDAASVIFKDNIVINASSVIFKNDNVNSKITYNNFTMCEAIRPNGSLFTYNNITDTTDTFSLYLDSISAINSCKNIWISKYVGSTALFLESTITNEITLDSYIFDNSGNDIHWNATSGHLIINLVNGSNPINYTTDGGTIEFRTIHDSNIDYDIISDMLNKAVSTMTNTNIIMNNDVVVNKPLRITISLDSRLSGLSSTFMLYYKKRDFNDIYQNANLVFNEEEPGYYATEIVFNSPGDYILKIDSSDDRIGIIEGNVMVNNVTINDLGKDIERLTVMTGSKLLV